MTSVSVKPGFGRRTEIPKNLTVKNSSSGGKNVTASTSSLRSSATQTISTSTLSNECRTRAASTKSDNFVPGQKPIEFTRNRTVTVPHGAFAAAGGKYQFESATGMTGRSMERLLKQQAQLQQQQQMAMLSQMNAMYGNQAAQQQTKISIGDIITMFSGLFGAGSAEKGAKANQTSAMSVLNNMSAQSSVASSISSADTSAEVKAAIGEAMNQKANLEQTLNSSDYQNVETNLANAKESKAQIDQNVKTQQGIVANQNEQINFLSGTRIPAQEGVVANAEQALEQAKSSNNQAAITSAQEALNQAKADLADLQERLEKATDARDKAQAQLDGADGLLAQQKEVNSTINTLTALQNDKNTKSAQLANLEQTIDKAEAKEEKLIAKEEKKLNNMFNDIQDLSSEIANEKDASKQQELRQEYAELAGEFNDLAGNTTSDRFANASLDGKATIADQQQATLKSNLEKMKQNADAYMQSRNK